MRTVKDPDRPATGSMRTVKDPDRPATGSMRTVKDADRPATGPMRPARDSGRPATGSLRPAKNTSKPAKPLARPTTDPLSSKPPQEVLTTEEKLESLIEENQQRLTGMLRIERNLNQSRDPIQAMTDMVEEISHLLHADRTTIYEIQDNMLRGMASQGEKRVQIGIPIGVGIAGYVAQTKKVLNLKDAYLHPKFDPKMDKLTGYRTRSMLWQDGSLAEWFDT